MGRPEATLVASDVASPCASVGKAAVATHLELSRRGWDPVQPVVQAASHQGLGSARWQTDRVGQLPNCRQWHERDGRFARR